MHQAWELRNIGEKTGYSVELLADEQTLSFTWYEKDGERLKATDVVWIPVETFKAWFGQYVVDGMTYQLKRLAQ